MRKILCALTILSLYAYGQCCLNPVSTRVGIKLGINYNVFDLDNDVGQLTGTGFHAGVGMGTDILKFIAVDAGAQIRGTKYGRTDEILGNDVTTTYSFTSIYLPVLVSLKIGAAPLVSPYLGIGLAGNFQINGTLRLESGGTALETEIEELENEIYFIGAFGTEIKLTAFHMMPEIAVNYNLSADDPDTPEQHEKNITIDFSLGLYYTP